MFILHCNWFFIFSFKKKYENNLIILKMFCFEMIFFIYVFFSFFILNGKYFCFIYLWILKFETIWKILIKLIIWYNRNNILRQCYLLDLHSFIIFIPFALVLRVYVIYISDRDIMRSIMCQKNLQKPLDQKIKNHLDFHFSLII